MVKTTIWRNKYFVAFMAVIACILWGSAFPVLKVTYEELQLAGEDQASRLLLAGMRFFSAAVLLFIFAKFALKLSWRVKKEMILPLILLGLGQTGLQYYFFYNGLAYTGGIKAAIINSAGNFLVVIFAHFLYADDKLSFGKAIGLLTGIAGIVLVNWESGPGGISWDFSFRGEGFLLLSGFASVFGTFQAKRLSQKLQPILINAYQLLFGSLLLLLTAAPGYHSGQLATTPLFWGLLIYSAFLSAVAFSIWYTLLRYNKAGEITLYRFLIPVSGAILSAFFLPAEHFTPAVFLALFLVALGLVVVNYLNSRTQKERMESSESY